MSLETKASLEEIQRELVDLIFDCCDVKEHTPDEVKPTGPLIGPESALGLDSLDALEIVVAVSRKYGVRIDNENTALQVLPDLDTLARYVQEHRTR